jgi:hypothetical protein
MTATSTRRPCPTEGGKGASVRYVLTAENRSAGSVMRYQLAPYCDEQRFIFERWRNR